MRIETTISSGLSRDWPIASAIAELIQNALDASGATIEHNGHLAIITDEGQGFDVQDLTFGRSDKSATQRGQYGRGSKDAFVVLTRANRNLVIMAKQTAYVPSFATHSALGTECLVIDVVAQETAEAGTRVTVECTEAELTEAKARFVEYANVQWIDKENGLSLPGGYCYVNGVFCGSITDAVFTYHFSGEDAQALNNEARKSIDIDKARWMAIKALKHANLDTALHLLPILSDSQTECWERCLWIGGIGSNWQTALLTLWGDKVVLTSDTDAVAALGYMGYTVKDLRYNWNAALEPFTASLNMLQAQKAKSMRVETELSARKQAMLETCLTFLHKRGIDVTNVHVAEKLTMDSGTPCNGLCVNHETIWLCASILTDRKQTISTLIHEYTHCETGAGDCSERFQKGLEENWVKLI